jgi:multidrug resistance efflux pump
VAASFPHTLRALETNGTRPTIFGLILITAILAVWSAWLWRGQVAVYEVSTTARLEVEHVHAVGATVGGRVAASYLALGRRVRRGDVLLDIEADRETLETNEERTRLTSLNGQVAIIATEIVKEEQALDSVARAARAALAEASERVAAAQAAVAQAEDQERRQRQLGARGLIAEADIVRAKAEADARRADVAAAREGIERLRAEQVASREERQAHLGALLRERVTLEGQRAATAAVVARHEREADERRIRAPVEGRLAEIAPLQVGAVIHEGERVATIVPPGEVKIVAEFPAPALGRLRHGQAARLRLDGFPWTQYGYVHAIVQSVASETREGRLRVELALDPSQSPPVALEHGLPGAVEVETERVAPAALLLRAVGRTVTASHARPDAASAPERSGT